MACCAASAKEIKLGKGHSHDKDGKHHDWMHANENSHKCEHRGFRQLSHFPALRLALSNKQVWDMDLGKELTADAEQEAAQELKSGGKPVEHDHGNRMMPEGYRWAKKTEVASMMSGTRFQHEDLFMPGLVAGCCGAPKPAKCAPRKSLALPAASRRVSQARRLSDPARRRGLHDHVAEVGDTVPTINYPCDCQDDHVISLMNNNRDDDGYMKYPSNIGGCFLFADSLTPGGSGGW